jgi:predicted nucleotidyltransferase
MPKLQSKPFRTGLTSAQRGNRSISRELGATRQAFFSSPYENANVTTALQALQFPQHRRILEAVLEELGRDSEVIAVMLAGSVARGDALPKSDLDLHLILQAGKKRAFRSETRDGVPVEFHAHNLESALHRLERRPSWAYAYSDGITLFDPYGHIATLKARAAEILKAYRTPDEERQAILYWLTSSARKLRAAMTANDPLREGMLASTTAWKILEGIFAANHQPTPASGEMLARVLKLQRVPDELELILDSMFTGGHDERIAVTLELLDWVRSAL